MKLTKPISSQRQKTQAIKREHMPIQTPILK